MNHSARLSQIFLILAVLIVLPEVVCAQGSSNVTAVDTLDFPGVKRIVATAGVAYLANDTAIVRFAVQGDTLFQISSPVPVVGTISDLALIDGMLLVAAAKEMGSTLKDSVFLHLLDDTTLEHLGTFRTSETNGANWPPAVTASGPRAYFCMIYHDLVVNIETPSAPVQSGQFTGDVDDLFTDLDISGNVLFGVFPDSLLRMYSLADVDTPAFAGDYVYLSTLESIKVSEGSAYVGYWGLVSIVDVRDPAQVVELGSYSTEGLPIALEVSGNLLFILNEDGLLEIVDISTFESPQLVGYYGESGTSAIACTGQHILSASADGVEVYQMTGALGVGESSGVPLPIVYFLADVYPNPFNPSFTLQLQFSRQVEFRAQLYDVLGREVATLASATFTPGIHVLNSGSLGLPSGMYLLKMTVPGKDTQVRRVMLLK